MATGGWWAGESLGSSAQEITPRRLAGEEAALRRGREMLSECESSNLAAKSQLSMREVGEAERGRECVELSQCSFHPSEGGEGATGWTEGVGV